MFRKVYNRSLQKRIMPKDIKMCNETLIVVQKSTQKELYQYIFQNQN